MRIGGDLLAATAGLASGRGVGPSAQRTAVSTAGRSPHRLEPGLHGQLVHRGQKGGAATGPNPTDQGRPGTKRHLITDRHGIPLAFLLTGANVHDSMPAVDLAARNGWSATQAPAMEACARGLIGTAPRPLQQHPHIAAIRKNGRSLRWVTDLEAHVVRNRLI